MARAEPPNVAVTFTVSFDYGRYYTEAELATAAPELLARLRAARTLEGSIDIAADSLPTTRIMDELAPWIQNLCFRAIPSLAAGEPARVLYFSRSGFLVLTPRADLVELGGDRNPAAAYPRPRLMKALVECGSRFLDFAGNIKRDDKDYMANLDYVRRFEGPARAALTAP